MAEQHKDLSAEAGVQDPCSLTIWRGAGGTSGSDPLRYWLEAIARYGHAVVDDSRSRPTNHRIIGVGVGHDDARWAESRFEEGSMAAYYENGAAIDGPWWADTDKPFSVGRKYYGCGDRQPELAGAAR